MAREFGRYSPAVPLGVTWEESLIFQDEDGNLVDLTGYDARAQFYVDVPTRDPDTTIAIVPPVVELTTADWYVSPPAWPVFEALSIPSPTNATLNLALDFTDLWTFSPSNAKAKFYWSVILVNPDTEYAIPAVKGRPVFLPAVTI